jgi:hypothetical protein
MFAQPTHRFFTASAFTSSQPHRDRPLGKEQNETKQAKRAAKTFLVWSSTLMTPAVLDIRGCTSASKDSTTSIPSNDYLTEYVPAPDVPGSLPTGNDWIDLWNA